MKLRNLLISACAMSAICAPAFAQSAGQTPPPPPPGHFDRVDTNHDGAISRDEARIAHVAKFNEIDTNHDGFLVADEFRANHQAHERRAGGQVRERMQEARMQRTQRFDTDNNGTISRQEWENGPARAREQAQKAHIERFAKLDTNNDGQLNVAELEAGRPTGQHGGRPNGEMRQGPMEERRMQHGPQGQNPPPNRADTNNDGKVSRAEWDAMQDGIFAAGDLNKDNKITREEAAQAVRNHGGRERMQGQNGGNRMFKTAPNSGAN